MHSHAESQFFASASYNNNKYLFVFLALVEKCRKKNHVCFIFDEEHRRNYFIGLFDAKNWKKKYLFPCATEKYICSACWK